MCIVDLDILVENLSTALTREYNKYTSWTDKKTRRGMQIAGRVVRETIQRFMDNPDLCIPEVNLQPPPPPPEKPKECDHKYRDYDWFALIEDETPGKLIYKIIEPYLCVRCRNRKDVILESGVRYYFDNPNSHNRLLEELKQLYPRLRNRAEVEDKISDDMLVDRDYLRFEDMLRGKKELSHTIMLNLPLSQTSSDEAMEAQHGKDDED